jgi:hypothetical protein
MAPATHDFAGALTEPARSPYTDRSGASHEFTRDRLGLCSPSSTVRPMSSTPTSSVTDESGHPSSASSGGPVIPRDLPQGTRPGLGNLPRNALI